MVVSSLALETVCFHHKVYHIILADKYVNKSNGATIGKCYVLFLMKKNILLALLCQNCWGHTWGGQLKTTHPEALHHLILLAKKCVGNM